MWFRVLGLVLAAALILKASVALAAPRRFYAARQSQYASASSPRKLMVAPALLFVAMLSAWYATIYHYRPWGWVVTGFLTLLSAGSLHHLARWHRHRDVMLKVVTNPRVWWVDCFLLALGASFAALALLVY